MIGKVSYGSVVSVAVSVTVSMGRLKMRELKKINRETKKMRAQTVRLVNALPVVTFGANALQILSFC